MKNIVSVVMGSISDLEILKPCFDVLDEFNIPYEKRVSSAHRMPHETIEYAKSAQENGIKVIIAAAGGAAHLPGVIAAITPIPVIGIPIKSNALNGVDSLYSIVQMPSGIPVACVGINASCNAGLLAISILGLSDASIMEKLIAYRIKLTKKAKESNEILGEK